MTMARKLEVGGDGFMCSTCFAVVPLRDVRVIPTLDLDDGWTGAYRCPVDRAPAYEAARDALQRCDEDHLAGFFATIERWGPPLVALAPFTTGRSLRDAALAVLARLEQGTVRLAPARLAPDGVEPAFFAVDIVLAFLIAPRGHAVDHRILPLLREGQYRAVLVEAAIHFALCAVQPADRVDTERWAELLALAEIDKSPENTDLPQPSLDEIAHWRNVVFGAD
jgi:hypothetical protein